jgi:hypothetical protein
MKNKPTGKKLLYKIALFSILLLLLNGVPHLVFSQDVPPRGPNKLPVPSPGYSPPDETIRVRTLEYVSPPFFGPFFPPDFVSPLDKTTPAAFSYKLTPEQIKKIVGNDKVLGKDAQGHQLYMNSKGETYYLLDNGTEVILK